MSSEPKWISTISINRFYDHCYLIECAYHIISRYCCSFTNLLAHDDGSIPYYLVQKVKIAIEYGRILLNSRYKPFQCHLRGLGVYDYIDQLQYEGLCIHWNIIKVETQIVEMYFNQISLLIYPVVSTTSLSFVEAEAAVATAVKDNEELSALSKINVLIHSIMSYEENNDNNADNPKCKKILTRRPKYFSEEELGVFIVNHIIEPLFDEDRKEASATEQSRTFAEGGAYKRRSQEHGRNTAYNFPRRYDYSRHKHPKSISENENVKIRCYEVCKNGDSVGGALGNGGHSQFYKRNVMATVSMDRKDECGGGFRRKSRDGKVLNKNTANQKQRYGCYEYVNKELTSAYSLNVAKRLSPIKTKDSCRL